MKPKIRVLVVDDSALVRRILTDALSSEPDIEVVGTAADPLFAQEKMAELKPDVLTLDIEMPRMDGLSFLRKLMSQSPMPVVIISSLAQSGCSAAIQALEAGAVEVLAKPAGPYSVGELRVNLAHKIRAAASARMRISPAKPRTAIPAFKKLATSAKSKSNTIIALGASTGGTEALREVLEKMPASAPPIVVVQHIPPIFSKAFADRLDKTCAIEVREAVDGDVLKNGLALIAPGDYHMVVVRGSNGLFVRLKSGPRVCYQRPAVDVLFQSVAETAGAGTVAALLTGMGSDGAQGMVKLKKAGATTIAQDEKSCVVYGMPREAVRLGAVDHVLPLDRIADTLTTLTNCALAAAAP